MTRTVQRRVRVLIVGCGYVGQRVATRLVNCGHAVVGWVASRESAEAVEASGARALVGNAADEGQWKGHGKGWDAVVFAASTAGGGEEAYRAIHGRALGLALEVAAGKPFVYTSSTSVYGQTDGSWVNEESPTEPGVVTGRILVEAEQAVLRAGGVVLRLGGIYGPGRAIYLRKLREGRATLPGGGRRWVNQIHREDAAGAIIWALDQGRGREVFNVVDDEPVRLVDLYGWLCREMGLPLPPEVAEEGASKRGRTDKRVSNARLAAVGWRPGYRSFREGYAALLSGG